MRKINHKINHVIFKSCITFWHFVYLILYCVLADLLGCKQQKPNLFNLNSEEMLKIRVSSGGLGREELMI